MLRSAALSWGSRVSFSLLPSHSVRQPSRVSCEMPRARCSRALPLKRPALS